MSRICSLFSGSRGNCTYISNAHGSILIDAGVSACRIEAALKERDIDPASIDALFVTHEHTDHISGVRVFASRYGTRVYATKGTLEQLDGMQILNGKFPVEAITNSGIETAGMKIAPFATSHDCKDSCGYVIKTYDGRKIAIATDLGYVSDEVLQSITGCDYVIIESNHDIHMLEAGYYPYPLKRLILSDKGHLSNDACAKLLPHLAQTGTTRFLLGHISENNNLPQIAYHTALNSLTGSGLRPDRDFLLSTAEPVSRKPVEIL